MRIWVDLANSPQVLVLAPVIRELYRRGHDVRITSRPFAQTTELADDANLVHTAVGTHGGRGLRKKAANLARALQLASVARSFGAELALSHNSYSHAIAARLLGVPFVTMMDYEFQVANHLAFRLARRVLVPGVFPEDALQRFGAAHKAIRYPGFKEQIYLAEFQPDDDYRGRVGLPQSATLVVLRPPATWADYYVGHGDLFSFLLDRLMARPEIFIVFLPRVPAQLDLIRDVPRARLLVPRRPLDGPNLVWCADAVFSGGGTMNREAAILGVPAFSLFEGRLCAVDRALMELGRLRAVTHESDLDEIAIAPSRGEHSPLTSSSDICRLVTDAILSDVAA